MSKPATTRKPAATAEAAAPTTTPAAAPEVAPAAPGAAKATPRPKPAPHACACSWDCTATTRRTFAQGHDARKMGWQVVHAAESLGVPASELAALRKANGAVLDILADRAADAIRSGSLNGKARPQWAQGVQWAKVPAESVVFKRAVAEQVAALILGL